MAKKAMEAPEWFFAWISGAPYITTICGWSRIQVLREVERSNGMPWKRIYGRGGRLIRCTVRPTSTRSK